MMENFLRDDRIHEGHRARMRAKLLEHGPAIFDTYELLEMLLYYVIPYKDTNPISKQLLYKFGTLDGVLSASKEELMSVKGIGERAAEFIGAVGSIEGILGACPAPDGERVLPDFLTAGEYVLEYYKNLTDSAIVLILLDNKMRCIKAVTLYTGYDYDSGAVKPKAFIDEAITANAAVAITAHSHLRGPLFPTEGDRATNNLLTTTLGAVGVHHIEHYLVSGNQYMGLINHFPDSFASNSYEQYFVNSKREAIELGLAISPDEKRF